jgi:hypothetical protein
LLAAWLVGAPADAAGRFDPGNVLGPKACKDCHPSETAAWERTAHHASRQAGRLPRAKEILAALGLRGELEASPLCARCHVTLQEEKGRAKAVAGVSCESCHGAARSWLPLHSDLGPGATRATETPAHREERLGASLAAGMLQPQHLYSVVANCYGCHTVPQERLVNRGGHTPGSRIELLAFSQGAVRHNFLDSAVKNREASAERKRLLFVVGHMLDLELALRGLATATADGPYARALLERVSRATVELERIRAATGIAEIGRILAAAKGVALRPNNEAALAAAADTVSSAAQDFADQPDRQDLAGVDPMLPSAASYKGPVYRP